MSSPSSSSTSEVHEAGHTRLGQGDDHGDLLHIIEHAAHLLPSQGPITAFVHHNTLHAFEDLPFEEAVRQGARVYGSQPYLSEKRYRELWQTGRIRAEELAAVLLEDLEDEADELIGCLGTRYHLRLAMLQHPLRLAPDEELRWVITETAAARRFRDDVRPAVRETMIQNTRRWAMRDLRAGSESPPPQTPHDLHLLRAREAAAGLFTHFGKKTVEQWSDATWEAFTLQLLWRICRDGVHGIQSFHPHASPPVRHRDRLLQATGEDSDRLVHDVLIRFCASFLDLGFAAWPLPQRERGFYASFLALYGSGAQPLDRWMRPLREEIKRLEAQQLDPLRCIQESLDDLGVHRSEYDEFILASLQSLRGWAGMIWQLETNTQWTVRAAPQGSLLGYLAIQLLLERFAVAHVAREALGFRGPLHELRAAAARRAPRHESVSVQQRSFLIFQLAQVAGWTPQLLHQLSKPQWMALVREVETFHSLERRKIYHLAYERQYRNQALDALIVHNRAQQSLPTATNRERQRPSFQIVCCIDDREESFRRHLEEIDPTCETFSVAGFFAVAMYYRGAADAQASPLCPIIVTPQHYVIEEVAFTYEQSHRRRAETRRALGTASLRFHIGSRTFAAGIVTALIGTLASFPMVTRILFPRLTAQIRRLFGQLVQPPPITHLQLERSEPQPGPEPGHVGYSVDEMADIVERVLRDLGITSNFARLIFMAGHGSSSLNNPHESAYNCGACSGGRGGPNARAFAHMANDPRVRDRLNARGLILPRDTIFIGTYHNTCDDSVTYFDLDRLPASHHDDFARANAAIDEARARNAHERCRRFESASLSLTPDAALRHVEGRAEDLSQARPEYNHATNALCIVGRRSRTRGLFLDRRAFLNSYDPQQDDKDHTILERILQAAVPVCAGISLEYYFSTVDVEGLGCGSKLPHNITSLLGVMTGAASDLRPGLSAQMVEIHEPMRLLFVIETTPEAMIQIMDRNPAIRRLCHNKWIQLAVLDPDSPEIQVLHNGKFEPYHCGSSELPVVETSVDWYRGWRDHLGFAVARRAIASVGTPSNDYPQQRDRAPGGGD